MVYRPFMKGDENPADETEFNIFVGYRAKELTECKVSEETRARLERVNNHWLETMCNNNREMFEYVMNWQAYIIRRCGVAKPRTMLVFMGKQGTGKNLMWERFFLNGILGRYNGGVYNNLDRFLKNFNTERLHLSLIHI